MTTYTVTARARRRAAHWVRRLSELSCPHDYVTPDPEVADAMADRPEVVEATDYRDTVDGVRRFRLAPYTACR